MTGLTTIRVVANGRSRASTAGATITATTARVVSPTRTDLARMTTSLCASGQATSLAWTGHQIKRLGDSSCYVGSIRSPPRAAEGDATTAGSVQVVLDAPLASATADARCCQH